MAQGEVGFTSEGRQAKRYVFEPPATGDYTGKLILKGAQAQMYENRPPPTVGGIRIELLDTAEEGGKNKSVFCNLNTIITPNGRGNVAWDNAKGPQGLLDALGVKFSAPASAIKSYTIEDEDGFYGEAGETVTVKLVDCKTFIQFLKQYDGRTVQLHVKQQRKKGQDPKGVVEYFIAAETEVAADEGGDTFEEAAPLDEELDAQGNAGADVETDEGVPEPEPEPVETKPATVKNGVKPHVAAAAKKPATKAGKSARR